MLICILLVALITVTVLAWIFWTEWNESYGDANDWRKLYYEMTEERNEFKADFEAAQAQIENIHAECLKNTSF